MNLTFSFIEPLSRRAGRSFFAGLLLALAGLAGAQTGAEVFVVRARSEAAPYAAQGVVEAVRQATVSAQVAGRVTELRVDAGQRVRAGELLMKIDAREASDTAAAAAAQLAQAKANLARAQDLVAKKFVSAAALDKAEADFKSARAAAGQAGTGLSYTQVLAPMAGVVARREVEVGEMASPGRPLLTLFDPQDMRVVASLPQYKMAELAAANAATRAARVEFLEAGRSVAATRVEVLPTLDAKTHTLTVRAYLPQDAGIRPGMAARVIFFAGGQSRLSVPAQTIIHRGEVAAVYVLDEKNQPQLRQVRLGEAAADGSVEVLAGLKDGERVSLDPVKTGIALRQMAK